MVNNENIESNENEVAKIFNHFFSNVVKNLKIPEYQFEDDLHNRLFTHPALQAMLKYRNHPSILATFGTPHKRSQAFIFHKSIQINSKKSEG